METAIIAGTFALSVVVLTQFFTNRSLQQRLEFELQQHKMSLAHKTESENKEAILAKIEELAHTLASMSTGNASNLMRLHNLTKLAKNKEDEKQIIHEFKLMNDKLFVDLSKIRLLNRLYLPEIEDQVNDLVDITHNQILAYKTMVNTSSFDTEIVNQITIKALEIGDIVAKIVQKQLNLSPKSQPQNVKGDENAD